MKLKAYLANPYGFSESTKHFLDTVYVPRLSKVVDVINPWNLTTKEEMVHAERQGKVKQFIKEIGRRNRKAIDESDIIIAALDGQEVDSGTASEIGYAAGIGKVIYGYRNDLRQTGEKGAQVNLQVEYFIESSGGTIVSDLESLANALQNHTHTK
jgi:nucleoside 2-deoxyribosyltransferase